MSDIAAALLEGTEASTFWNASRARQLGSRPNAVQLCRSAYSEFLPTIYEDLRLWAGHGITEDLMNIGLEENTRFADWAGLPIIFKNGVAYTLGPGEVLGEKLSPWHKREIIIYAHVMVHLATHYGKNIPDLELIIQVEDDMGAPIDAASPWPPPPYFRYCKTDDHPEILIPCWHLYEHKYTEIFLAPAKQRDQEYPWEAREQVLYNNAGGHYRAIANADTRKLNYTGANTTTPRLAFVQWANSSNNSLLDIQYSRFTPLEEWYKYRYIAHVDGITCSCRLDKLLSLGSLLFKEDSGYRSFYHRLIKPMVHYIPFWHKLPQEALWGLNWALANDKEAQKIAQNAQQLVQKILTKQALDCYWLMLFHEYRKLFKYQPAGPKRRYMKPLVKLKEWLEFERRNEAETYVNVTDIELTDGALHARQEEP